MSVSKLKLPPDNYPTYRQLSYPEMRVSQQPMDCLYQQEEPFFSCGCRSIRYNEASLPPNSSKKL